MLQTKGRHFERRQFHERIEEGSEEKWNRKKREGKGIIEESLAAICTDSSCNHLFYCIQLYAYVWNTDCIQGL